VELAKDQLEAFNFIENSDGPIIVTGAAGTGKSALLRYLVENGKDSQHTVVAAFTGTAALNVGGITLHELALQSKAFNKSIQVFCPLEEQRELKKKKLDFLSMIRLLVIDEISMVRADMIDALDRVFRLANRNSEPFGGIRLVMFGDPFQLPPFVKEGELFRREKRFLAGYEEQKTTYFHYAHCFTIAPITSVQLYIPKRQSGQTERDLQFVSALNEIRTANPKYKVFRWLNKEARRANFRDEMRLFARRKDAAIHNSIKLGQLESQLKTFVARITSFDQSKDAWYSDQDYPAPEFLEIKVNAPVMVVANINIAAGLVNGAVGTVLDFDEESIKIKLRRDGAIHNIERHPFDRMGYVRDVDGALPDVDSDVPRSNGKVQRQIVGTFSQFPLTLAWGVTIHKAQGATLDEVVIDFKESFRDPGQAYVALSRVRSVDGLGFIGKFEPSHLKSFSQRHIEFVSNLQRANALLENQSSEAFTFEQIETEFLRKSPWRNKGWLLTILENYVDYLPAIKDNTGFNLRRRIVYLRDYAGVPPFDYLVRQANQKGMEFAVDICRNLERSLRNRLPILRGYYAESSFDELCLDKYEISESKYWSMSWKRQDDKKGLEELAGKGKDQLDLENMKAIQTSKLEEINWISRGGKHASIRPSKSGKSWQYFDSLYAEGQSNIDNNSLFLTMLHYRNDFEARGCNYIDFKGDIAGHEVRLWLRWMFSEFEDISVTVNGSYLGTYSDIL